MVSTGAKHFNLANGFRTVTSRPETVERQRIILSTCPITHPVNHSFKFIHTHHQPCAPISSLPKVPTPHRRSGRQINTTANSRKSRNRTSEALEIKPADGKESNITQRATIGAVKLRPDEKSTSMIEWGLGVAHAVYPLPLLRFEY
jgi:hypothetical protein